MSGEVAPRKPQTFRLPVALVTALEDRAALDETSKTAIVERALTATLESRGRLASPQLRGTDTIGLATFLSGRTGMPHALCKRFVRQGRVKVGGKVCKDAIVARGRLGDVQLDGEPVTPG